MSIDDRIRSAQKRQVDLIAADLRRRSLDRAPMTSNESPARFSGGPWIMAVAAAVLLGGLAVTFWPSIGQPTEVITSGGDPLPETDMADGGELVDSTTTTSTTSTTSTTTAGTASSGPSTADTPGSGALPSSAPTSIPTPNSGAPTSSDPGSESTTIGDGVANNVCGTGFRAPLERAALRYLTDEQGWNRMADLTDEQEGPYYYGLWEPNYPGLVTVEVSLAEPVEATEIRLAQHPFEEVAGTIIVEFDGNVVPIELSGVGGWRSHTLAQPTVLDSFTITRSQVESNIVEVLVCTTR